MKIWKDVKKLIGIFIVVIIFFIFLGISIAATGGLDLGTLGKEKSVFDVPRPYLKVLSWRNIVPDEINVWSG